MSSTHVIMFEPTSDVLDAYGADLGNSDVPAFSAQDAIWLAFGTVLQRAAALTVNERDEYVRGGVAAISATAAIPILATDASLPEALSATSLSVANDIEDAGAFALATTILDWTKCFVGPTEPRYYGRIVAQQARILRKIGELDASRDAYETVYSLGNAHADHELTARAHLGKGVIARLRGNYPEARAEFLAVLETPPSSDEIYDLHIHAHHGLMIAAAVAEDFDVALAHGRDALEGARNADHRIELLANLAGVCLLVGRYRAALNAYLRVLAASAQPRIRLTAIGGASIGAAHLRLRYMVSQLAETGARAADHAGHQYERADMLAEIAEAFGVLGDGKEADLYRQRALTMARRGGFHEIVHRIESMASRPRANPSEPVLAGQSVQFTDDLAVGDTDELLSTAISSSRSGW